MSEINVKRTVLVVMPLTLEHKAEIESALADYGDVQVIYSSIAEVGYELAQNAEVIIGNVPPALIKDSKKLKLLQLNSAGTDGYTTPGVMPKQAVLKNATGAYGLAISEHMIGMLLEMMKKLDLYRLSQEKQTWSDYGEVRSIYGSKTLVVGMGDIGSEFAKRMNALGSSVTGIKRNVGEKPEYVEKICTTDSFYECLEEADIVASCLPGSPETCKLFNAEAFSHMKRGAYFLNVGRGISVDSDALCEALEKGQLAGAGLDVTDPEPLPKDHKLWSAPGIIITPHISGGYHLKETHNRIIEIAIRNMLQYL